MAISSILLIVAVVATMSGCVTVRYSSSLEDPDLSSKNNSYQPILGTIPPAQVIRDGGCSHYVTPMNNPEDYNNRVIFQWGYNQTDKPVMRLSGKTVAVNPVTDFTEKLITGGVGSRFREEYRIGPFISRFDNVVTFVCPSDEDCSVTRFRGTLTVNDGKKTERYLTVGECGS